MFFKEKRYDLARVGRYKVNKKLGLNVGKPITNSTLTKEDIVATIEYLVRLHETPEGQTSMMTARGGTEVPVEVDDIDHFGNRRLRTVGELACATTWRSSSSAVRKWISSVTTPLTTLR